MSRKYEKLAGEIVKGLGGKENVNDVYHCQTRLRFKLADVFEEVEKLVDTNKGKGSAKAEEEKQNVFEKVFLNDMFDYLQLGIGNGK